MPVGNEPERYAGAVYKPFPILRHGEITHAGIARPAVRDDVKNEELPDTFGNPPFITRDDSATSGTTDQLSGISPLAVFSPFYPRFFDLSSFSNTEIFARSLVLSFP